MWFGFRKTFKDFLWQLIYSWIPYIISKADRQELDALAFAAHSLSQD